MGQVISSAVNWLLGKYFKRHSNTSKLSEPINSAPDKANYHVINIDSIPVEEDEAKGLPFTLTSSSDTSDDQEGDGFFPDSDFVAVDLNDPFPNQQYTAPSNAIGPSLQIKDQEVLEESKSSSRIADDPEEEKHVVTISDFHDLIAAPELKKKHHLKIKPERWIKHYCSSHNILLVGEGNFSFSLCLAKAFDRADGMTATSLDSEGFLRTNYKTAMSNIIELKSRGCKVKHKVDATKMASYQDLNVVKYDRIVYNFPLAGFFPDESRTNQLRRNKKLVELFLKNAKQMISETGEIHISHKSNGFFHQWDLQGLANGNGLKLVESLKFNLKDYPGYNTKYGFGGDKNFDCNPSKTYKFRLIN